MSYFSKRSRTPSPSVTPRGKRTCFGIDFNRALADCRNCKDRFDCAAVYGDEDDEDDMGPRHRSTLSSIRKPKKVATAPAKVSKPSTLKKSPKDAEPFIEVDPPRNMSVAKVYAHNAAIGAFRAASNELAELADAWPLYTYRNLEDSYREQED